ncbi:MAG TPA: response regulator [Burkholderiaceae bacterium]|jgi:DNA-binding response OmpR family regulator|nr:response regulator [Burkholderiaceae bacterium]
MSDIVIIEEDALMRGLLVEWLSAEGYPVRACARGEPREPGEAALVIVDVVRPRQEGTQRLREVRAAHPGAALIAISGQFRPGLGGYRAAADALGVRQMIAKPFSRSDLLAAVHRVIGPAR